MPKLFWVAVFTVALFVALTASLSTGALIAHYVGVAEVQAGGPPSPVAQTGPVNTLTNDLDTTISVAATPTCTQVAAKNSGRRAIAVQNLGTVVICCSKNAACTCASPPASSSGMLKAATSATTGDGGTYGLSQYAGAIFCSSSSGAVNVLVGSF